MAASSISLHFPTYFSPYCPTLSYLRFQRGHHPSSMSLLGQCEWNFSFKKADWGHFTYFIEQLCLQLKIFPSFSLWDDGAWTLRECRYLWGGGGGGAHCGAGCLSHCCLTPFLVYFCCCILAAILLIQSGLVCLFLDVFKGNFPLDCSCILNLSSTLRSIVPCCAWMSEINLETCCLTLSGVPLAKWTSIHQQFNSQFKAQTVDFVAF